MGVPGGDPGAVRAAARALAALGDELDSSAGRLGAIPDAVSAWTGSAHDAFVGAVGRERAQITGAPAALRLAGSALNVYAGALELAQEAWSRVPRDLRDGSVTSVLTSILTDPLDILRLEEAQAATLAAATVALGVAVELEALSGGAPTSGPVQHNPRVYAIFVGSSWNDPANQGKYGQIQTFLQTLAQSPDQAVISQYRDANGTVGLDPTYGGSVIDTHAPAGTLDGATLNAIVAQQAQANGWTLDGNSQVIVFGGEGTSVPAGEYGHHQTADIGGQTVPVAVIGNNSARTTTITASHEYAEAATDPTLNAYESPEGEIGDLVNQHPAPGPGGITVQQQWDQRNGRGSP